MKPLFWFRVSKNNPSKGVLYCLLSINGQRAKTSFSTKISIEKYRWDSKNQRVKGRSEYSQYVNRELKKIEQKLIKIYLDHEHKGELVSPDKLKALYFGEIRPLKEFTLLELSKQFQIERQKQIGHGLEFRTWQTNETQARNLKAYLEHQLSEKTKPSSCRHGWLDNYKIYLMATKKYRQGYAMKCLGYVKQVMQWAQRQGHVAENPTVGYSTAKSSLQAAVYLEPSELLDLEKMQPNTATKQAALDRFLFGCYTGLAYSDISKVCADSIKEIQGLKCLSYQRAKTKQPALVPLTLKAEKILLKYNGKMPDISNQKNNLYLKQLAAMAKIQKKIGTHTARHTFAMNALNSGIPIETVSRMMGHSSIKITESVYARIKDTRVVEDWKAKMVG